VDSAPLPRRWTALALALLVVGALGLRSIGIAALLPTCVEPDADTVRQVAWLDAWQAGSRPPLGELSPDYPLLLASVVAFGPQPTPITSPGLAGDLARAALPVVHTRRAVAGLSLLGILALYALARRFLGARGALFAAGLAATSLLWTVYAQQARPHAAFAALAACALLAQVRLVERGGLGAHLVAGLATGLALATLHFGVFLIPALAVASLLASRGEARGRRLAKLALALAVVGLLGAVAYPTLLESARGRGLHVAGSTLNLTGHRLHLERFHGRGFALIPRWLWSFDPLLLIAAGLGIVRGAWTLTPRRRPASRPSGPAGPRRAALVIAAYAVPFFLVLGSFDHAWDKYVLPLLPVTCLLAATGSRAVLGPLRRARPRLAVVAAGLLLGVPTATCVRWAWVRTRPDTTELAARWLLEEAHAEDLVWTSATLTLPLRARPDAQDSRPDWALSLWDRYSRENEPTSGTERAWHMRSLYRPSLGRAGGRARVDRATIEEVLRSEGGRWVLAEVRGPWRGENDQTGAAAQAIGGRLVRVIDAFARQGGVTPGRGYVLGDDAWRWAWRAERLGPPIEIWALPER